MVTASSICNHGTLELEREKTLWLKAGLFFLKHLKPNAAMQREAAAGRNADG